MPKTILQHSTKERNNLRVSSVGHFSFLKRSSYSISLRFFPRETREALRWTLSKAITSLAKYGFQAGAAYSRTGRTRDLYNVENVPGFDEPTVLWTKPNNLLALLTVTLRTCSLQDKSEEAIMPKSLTHFRLLRLVPNEYVGRERSRLCVYVKLRIYRD